MALIFSIGMCFQPGWANGWPGISKHAVFATFVTSVFTVVSIGGSGAVLSGLCYLADRLSKTPSIGWALFSACLLASFVCVWLAIPGVYDAVHESIVREWP